MYLLAVDADTFPDRELVVLVSPKTAALFADGFPVESAPNPVLLKLLSLVCPLLAG